MLVIVHDDDDDECVMECLTYVILELTKEKEKLKRNEYCEKQFK